MARNESRSSNVAVPCLLNARPVLCSAEHFLCRPVAVLVEEMWSISQNHSEVSAETISLYFVGLERCRPCFCLGQENKTVRFLLNWEYIYAVTVSLELDSVRDRLYSWTGTGYSATLRLTVFGLHLTHHECYFQVILSFFVYAVSFTALYCWLTVRELKNKQYSWSGGVQ